MTIRVKHPKDHPDVQAEKEDDYKGKYYKDKKKSARRFADTVQTMMAKKRSETEGSFRKGGRVNTRRENRLEELGRVDAEKAYTKKGCTGREKALAMTFKKMAKKRKGKS